jgi:hypothetical protein
MPLPLLSIILGTPNHPIIIVASRTVLRRSFRFTMIIFPSNMASGGLTFSR